MDPRRDKVTHSFNAASPIKLLGAVLVIALVLGVGSGYYLASTQASGGSASPIASLTQTAPKSAQQDNQTFKDFAEGKITKKPDDSGDDYSEGTHLLIRDGAVPVALTSSVVDLSQYENKKVKVYGETQKAVKEGWLMDVGKVDVEQ